MIHNTLAELTLMARKFKVQNDYDKRQQFVVNFLVSWIIIQRNISPALIDLEKGNIAILQKIKRLINLK